LAICYYITARAQLGNAWGAEDGAENLEGVLQLKVRDAIAAGVDYIQVREKDLTAKRLAALVENLGRMVEDSHVRLMVNERLDIAVSCGADGVHLPSGSLPLPALRALQEGPLAGPIPVPHYILWGVSCHDERDVARAAEDGATYVLLGPVFETPSKPGAKPLGLRALKKVCRRYEIPVFALGGVNAENAEDCIRAGAAGVAGIRMFQQAADLGQLCRDLHSLENRRRPASWWQKHFSC